MEDVTKSLDFVRSHTLDNIINTQIRDSELHGFGLFATKKKKLGDILTVLDGQVMHIVKYQALINSLSKELGKYKNYFLMECNILDKDTCIVRAFRTKYSYINHSRSPNVRILKYPLRVVAIKDIDIDEEIVIDYREEDLSEEYLSRDDKQFL